jgi:hypothetical protein
VAEMTIRLRVDPETGKKDILVSLASDADALPHEHEQQHRQLVDRLVEGGLLKQGEVGKVVIEREEESGVAESPPEGTPREERRSEAADT